MGSYAIGLLMGCMFLSTIDAVKAIQCHRCSYSNIIVGTRNITNGDPKCKDPFDSTDIEVVECSGQCYADRYDSSFGGTNFEDFSRGCAANAGIDCEALQGCVGLPSGSLICVYCCDQNGCNSQDIREVDENLFKCYNCLAYLDENGMPVDNGTCGRADFDGTNDPYNHDNVFELFCQTGTCITQINIAAGIIVRGCAREEAMDLCVNKETYEVFGGMKINCCTDKLCNVGRPSFEPQVTNAPRPVIDCFTCSANLTADGLPVDQSSCGRADFDGSGQDVFFLPCETGVCATIYFLANQTAFTSLIQRRCAPAELIPYCDNLIRSILGVRGHIECCYEDKCNTVNLVTTDSDATTKKTLVTVTGTDKLEYTMTTSDKLKDTMATSGADGITQFAESAAVVLIFSAAFFTYGVV